MKLDPIIDEVDIVQVRRLAKIIGPYSAAAKALEWAHNAAERCFFFRAKSGALIAVAESTLLGMGDLKNVALEQHFVVIPESQFVSCIHCGKRGINNQGLAKLAHLAKCTRSGAKKKPKPKAMESRF